MSAILIKAYCDNVVVDIKPIYFNKEYLFQNKIYYLDKIYLSFTKIKFSKYTLYRISCPDVFCKKGVLRNFAKFTGKNTCTRVGGLRADTLLKKRLWHRCFSVNFAKFLRTCFSQNTFGDWFCLYKLNWLPV